MKFLCFTWNTDGIRLCESLDENVVKRNRKTETPKSSSGWGSFLAQKLASYIPSTWQFSCEIADFTDYMIEKVYDSRPDFIVISFQDDAYVGSYYHSHLLPQIMKKLDFTLVKRNKHSKIQTNTLRTSVYVRRDLIDMVEKYDYNLREEVGNLGQHELTHLTGDKYNDAIVSYIKVSSSVIAIINCKFSSYNDNEALNKVMDDFVVNSVVNVNVSSVILMGDLNFRIMVPEKYAAYMVANNMITKENGIKFYYDNYDRLHHSIDNRIVDKFKEGVDNMGPEFYPTCVMKQNRPDDCIATGDCWDYGKLTHRVPSWCDRIIYKNISPHQETNIECIEYDRFDIGNTMKKSSHAGVMGLFELIENPYAIDAYDMGLM